MGIWEQELQEAKLDGIAFPIGNRQVSYGRDGARIRLPYVDGQDVEDTGRVPRTYSFDVPCFPDVEGYEDLWPGTYDRLVALVESPRSLTQVTYTDPVHGDVDVRVWSLQETTSPDMRDGAILRFEVEEVSFDVTGTTVVVRSPARDGESAAREADDAIAEDEIVTEGQVKEAMGSTGFRQTPAQRRAAIAGAPIETMWRDFAAGVDGVALAVDQAAVAVDVVRAKVNAILALPAMVSTDAWALRGALLRVVDAAGRLAESAVARAVPTREITLTGEVSVYELATALYGDASRADEILRRNSVRSPMALRRGTVIRVAQR